MRNPGLPDSKTQAFSYVVVVQLLSCVQLFATPQATARQASSASGVCSNSCPLSQWCHSTLLSSVTPFFSCPQSLPALGSFSNELALRIRWPKYWGFNFSISPSNEYSGLISFRMDWLISLLSKGLSRVFSSTTVQKHQVFNYCLLRDEKIKQLTQVVQSHN